MQNEHVENIRPFARVMATEVATEDTDLIAKKGNFNSLPSGGVPNDWPDMG